MHIIKNFYAMMIIKEHKFERYRDQKLKEICERLAILRIKRYWKKKRLSVRIMRQKIRRFKRKRLSSIGLRPRGKPQKQKSNESNQSNAPMQTITPVMDEVPSGNLRSARVSPDPDSVQDSLKCLNIEGNTNSAKDFSGKELSARELTLDDARTDEDNRASSEASSNVEEQEQMRKLILIEEERKRRVEYGYKSYCIHKPKPKRVFPLLSERTFSPEASFIDSLASPSPTRMLYDDSPIKAAPVPIEIPSTKKLPSIPKVKFRSKRLQQNPDSDEPEEPSYMKATESSNRARWDHSLLVAMREDETPRVLKKYTGHNFLMHPTVSYNMKIQPSHKRNNSTGDAKFKKPWRPNTIYDSPYIPSISSPINCVGTPKLFNKPRTTSFLPSPKSQTQAELSGFENNVQNATQPVEIQQFMETKPNIVTLSFQDALPEISGLLEKYSGSLPPLRSKKPFEIIPLTRGLKYRKNCN
jgi:hypothetical protein